MPTKKKKGKGSSGGVALVVVGVAVAAALSSGDGEQAPFFSSQAQAGTQAGSAREGNGSVKPGTFVVKKEDCDHSGARHGGDFYEGRVPPGKHGGSLEEQIADVLKEAKWWTQQKVRYSWAAGGREGPSCGNAEGRYPSDNYVFGFDCSGWTQFVWWRILGIDIGKNTSAQISLPGRDERFVHVSLDELRPGDLVFWGVNSTTHVAIVVSDDGDIYEATRPHIQRSRLGKGDQLNPRAVRYRGAP